MATKLEKLSSEIRKTKNKRDALDKKIQDLESQYKTAEKEEIYEMVKAIPMTLEELAQALPALRANQTPTREGE